MSRLEGNTSIVQAGKERLNEIWRYARNEILGNKTPYITAAIALLGLAIVEYPFSNSLGSLIDHMGSGVLAIPTWELPQKEGVTEMLKTPEGVREIAKFVAIDGGIVSVAGFVRRIAENILPNKKHERAILGVEPIGKHDMPKHVIIGPAESASDIARHLYENKPHIKNKPVVVVHVDDQVPARFGQEVDFHFKLAKPEGLIDTFTRGKNEFIEVSGIQDAEELTFICVNPQNAVFYGSSGGMDFSPDMISTVLKKIPPDKLKGKKVNVMAPLVQEVGGLSSIQSELYTMSQRLGFTLIYKTPEEMLMVDGVDKIPSLQERLRNIAAKTQDEKLQVVLVGQAGETNIKDALMLSAFARAISELSIGKEIQVDIIKRLDSNEVSTDPGILKKAHYILCYGNSDSGTTSIIRMLMSDESLGIDKGKIGAVIEKITQMFDVDIAPENVFLIYEMMLKAFSSV